MLDITAEVQGFLSQIITEVDPEYQAAMNTTVQTGLKIYGVRVPKLREMIRRWHQVHKDLTRQEWLALVEALWAGESREERMLACYLLERRKRWIPDLTWSHFDRWRQGLDNWEVADGLSQWVMGPWILAAPEQRLAHLQDLIAGENLWSRRLALVATAWLNRGYKGFSCPDLTLELVEQVKGERHSMITKAVSWALRGMIKTHPEKVDAYLEGNRASLAAHVVREVENKLRTGLKSGKG